MPDACLLNFASKGRGRMIPRILKKSVLVFTVSGLALTQVLAQAEANPYMAVDVASGKVLAHNDAFKRWYPASLSNSNTISYSSSPIFVTVIVPLRIQASPL